MTDIIGWIKEKFNLGDDLWNKALEKLGIGDGWAEIFQHNLDMGMTEDELLGDLTNKLVDVPMDGSTYDGTPTPPAIGPANVFICKRNDSDGNPVIAAGWTWSRSTAFVRETESYRLVWMYTDKSGQWIIESEETISARKDGSAAQIEASKYAEHSINKNALQYKVEILPIAATYKQYNGQTTQDVMYWTAGWAESKKINVTDVNLTPPSQLNLTVIGNSLTARVDVSAEEFNYIKKIEIQFMEDEKKYLNNTPIKLDISELSRAVTYSTLGNRGKKYKFRARTVSDKITGKWSDWSNEVETIISPPEKITTLKACFDANIIVTDPLNRNFIAIEWSPVSNANQYIVQYTTLLRNFERNTNFNSVTVEPATEGGTPVNNYNLYFGEIGNDIIGSEVFFRVLAVDKNGNPSDPCPTKSIMVGLKPNAPTTWQSVSANTTDANKVIRLYWVHNSADNSDMNQCQVIFKMKNNPNFSDEGLEPETERVFVFNRILDNSGKPDLQITNRAGLGDKWIDVIPVDRTVLDEQGHRYFGVDGDANYVTIRCDSENMSAGGEIEWYVRSRGVTKAMSKGSVARTANVYPTPTITCDLERVDDDGSWAPLDVDPDYGPVVRTYPFYIMYNPNGHSTSQYAISFTVKMFAEEAYDMYDEFGNKENVPYGTVVYERTFVNDKNDSTYMAMEPITPGVAYLQNIRKYSAIIYATFNTGLRAQSQKREFTILLDAVRDIYANALVTINQETLTASISPYVTDINGEFVGGASMDVYRKTYNNKFIPIELDVKSSGYNYGPNLIDMKSKADVDFAAIDCSYFVSKVGSVVTRVPAWKAAYGDGPGICPRNSLAGLIIRNDLDGGVTALCSNWNTYNLLTPFWHMNDPGYGFTIEAGKKYRFSMSKSTDLPLSIYLTSTGKILGQNAGELISGYSSIIAGATTIEFTPGVSGECFLACGTFPPNTECNFYGIKLQEVSTDADRFITDPHPELDYARYRIVAKNPVSGSVTVTDTSPLYVGEKSIVVQWDESWEGYFQHKNGFIYDADTWNGSMLKLPYNIDISNSYDKDVTTVDYIGRESPVSYYGSKVGEKGTWKVDIPRDDKETIYMLRKLQQYRGDVYVREPSGVGYWATISVEFPINHMTVISSVTLTVQKVEGGI